VANLVRAVNYSEGKPESNEAEILEYVRGNRDSRVVPDNSAEARGEVNFLERNAKIYFSSRHLQQQRIPTIIRGGCVLDS